MLPCRAVCLWFPTRVPCCVCPAVRDLCDPYTIGVHATCHCYGWVRSEMAEARQHEGFCAGIIVFFHLFVLSGRFDLWLRETMRVSANDVY